MRLSRAVLLLSLLLPVLAAPSLLRAQDAPSTDAPPVSDAPDTQDANGQNAITTLKVSSNLVSLFFTVRDKHNGLVPTLTKNDCNIYEDRVQQTIKDFSTVSDLPLTIGILLDTSGSQMNVLPMEQQTGAEFLKQILKPKDEAFLISFDVNVNLLADYTSSAAQLTRAMDKATINTGGGSGGVPGIGQGPIPQHGDPKGTLLYDAVYLASHDKLRQETGRKVLILLTDGQDQGSQEKPSEAIEDAQKANAIVYVLEIADRGFYSNGGINLGGFTGDSAMRKLAGDTGGRVIDVGNNGKKMEAAFAQIEEELRTQYLASYTPMNPKLDGSYRTIQIQCKGDGLKVQARKGYYAMPSDDTN